MVATRAQRLSASKRIARYGLSPFGHAIECSTPFGIKEDRTQCGLCNFDRAPVLNAFRHQRGSHNEIGVEDLADNCAQRLSASKRIAPSPNRQLPRGLPVLNAFRHQRGSHLHRCNLPLRRHERAQRLSASKRIAPSCDSGLSPTARLCSTPFGIKEDRTLIARYETISAGMCSTPFGIKEDRTPQSGHNGEESKGCSTPFGIKEDRTGYALDRFGNPRECSTPFGIKEDRTDGRIRKYLDREVLNAFRHQRGSHNLYLSKPEQPIVCSTPFGIKEDRTEEVCRQPGRERVLNAFRHQRGSHSTASFYSCC